MGVNTRIWLSPTTDFNDLITALLSLAGSPAKSEKHSYGTVPVRTAPHHVRHHDFSPTMVTVTIPCPARIDEVSSVDVHVHLNVTSPSKLAGHVYLAPGANSFWLAVGKRLVEIFGGHIDYVDYDEPDYDYSVRQKTFMGSDDGPSWQRRQNALIAIKPVTAEEQLAMNAVAAYPLEPRC